MRAIWILCAVNVEWIISLAAVVTSLVTVVVSYLMNKETMKNASENMLTERGIDFRVSIWNDIVELSDKLVLETNADHLEQFVNIVVAGKSNDTKDEEILNRLNANCEQVRSLVFLLCSKIKAVDGASDELISRIRNYAQDIISLYKQMQTFYLNKNATKDEFKIIVENVNAFEQRSLTFSHTMQDYVSTLQTKLFSTDKRKDKK